MIYLLRIIANKDGVNPEESAALMGQTFIAEETKGTISTEEINALLTGELPDLSTLTETEEYKNTNLKQEEEDKILEKKRQRSNRKTENYKIKIVAGVTSDFRVYTPAEKIMLINRILSDGLDMTLFDNTRFPNRSPIEKIILMLLSGKNDSQREWAHLLLILLKKVRKDLNLNRSVDETQKITVHLPSKIIEKSISTDLKSSLKDLEHADILKLLNFFAQKYLNIDKLTKSDNQNNDYNFVKGLAEGTIEKISEKDRLLSLIVILEFILEQ